MRVLITGATGFIGSHLARTLVREGNTVYAVVRENSATWRIDDILPSIQLIREDLLSGNDLGKQFGDIQPDVCFHLAWYAEPGRYLDAIENVTMLKASLDLVTYLHEAGCKRLVVTGTCFEYDVTLGRLSEETPLRPDSIYGATKAALYLVLEQVTRKVEIDFTWARLFNQFGPYEDRLRLVPSVIEALLENESAKVTRGEQIRDFLHVTDVASALIAASRSEATGAVNIASGNATSVRDLVVMIGEILGRTELIEIGAIPYRQAEPMRVVADNQKLLRNIGWRPSFTLEGGLRDTVEWWKKRHLTERSRLRWHGGS